MISHDYYKLFYYYLFFPILNTDTSFVRPVTLSSFPFITRWNMSGHFYKPTWPTSKIIRKLARPLRSHLDVGCLIPSLSRPGVGRDQAHPQEYQEAQHNQTCSRALVNNINILNLSNSQPASLPSCLLPTTYCVIQDTCGPSIYFEPPESTINTIDHALSLDVRTFFKLKQKQKIKEK